MTTEFEVTVLGKGGLHLRAAAELFRSCKAVGVTVTLRNPANPKAKPANSVIGSLLLQLAEGTRAKVTLTGESHAIDHCRELIPKIFQQASKICP